MPTSFLPRIGNMVGDSGSGGQAGLVPAPAAGSGSSGAFLNASGTFSIPAGTSAVAPTVQVFTASGTTGIYVRPTSPTPLYLKIKLVGGGQGGSGSGTTPGSSANGGTTFFGTSFICGPGAGRLGGTATNGDINITGGDGDSTIGGTTNVDGGAGGCTPLGKTGRTAGGGPNAGDAAKSNTGAGGGGASCAGTASAGNGGGGGAYLEKIINSPGATFSYGVGIAGTPGAAGGSGATGGLGGSGLVYIEEHYQ